jgi:hypothetical protein
MTTENGYHELDRRVIRGDETGKDKLILIFEEDETTRQFFLRLKTYEGTSVHCFTKPDSAWNSTSYLIFRYGVEIQSSDPDLQIYSVKALERRITDAARDMFMKYRKMHKKEFA